MTARLYRVGLGLLLGATVAGLLGLQWADRSLAIWFDNLHWTASFLAAALLVYQGYRLERDAGLRHMRRWLLAGAIALCLGQLTWDVIAALGWTPVPNLADPFFLAIGPLMCVGLWRLGRQRLSATDWRTLQLDAAALAVATLAVTFALFLPRRGDASLAQILTLAAYPLSLVGPTALGLLLALKLRSPPSWRVWLLPCSTAALMLCWGAWNLELLSASTVDGSVTNLMFTVAALALGLGARAYRLDTVDDARWDRRCELVLRLLPLLLVVLAALGVVLTTSIGDMPQSTRLSVQLGAALVVGLAVVRQALQLQERDRLIVVERMLRQREAELETRVAERTRELVAAREAAEAASLAKSEFLANMSHEIRTPLNAVLGFAQVAAARSSDPLQRQWMAKILLAGRQLLRLINDILDMSKIEAHKLDLEQVRFEPATLLRAIEQQSRDMAQHKGLVLAFDLASELERPLSGDPLRVGQIVTNFVDNAIKFTATGQVTVRGRWVSHDERSAELRIEVRDTGPGLSPQALARVFDAFEQADSSTTRHFGGTGLGLAICRQLAALMGGAVGASSAPGEGSLFWFTVRLDKAPGPVEAPPAVAPAAGPQPPMLQGVRLLLAEDNELNQVLACTVLEALGCQVQVAASGIEAIEALRAQPFDCVLMDVQMPRMDGLTATRLIRAEGLQPGIPIIAMTANVMAADQQACLDAGMNDFVGKPFELPQLLQALTRWQVRPGRPP